MTYNFRLTILTLYIFTISYFFSLGFTKYLELPISPQIDSSLFFLIYSIYSSFAALLLPLIICLIIYIYKQGFPACITKIFRHRYSKWLLTLPLLIYYPIRGLLDESGLFLHELVVLYLLMAFIYMIFSTELASYEEKTYFNFHNFLFLIVLTYLSIFLFFVLGYEKSKKTNFQELGIVLNSEEVLHITPLWINGDSIFAISCPELANTYIPTTIEEYKNGKLMYKYNHISRELVSHICSRK